jgi:N-acetylglucosaminyl-diphospho-decaprenol L-rhamnosyltransferase
MPRLLSSLRRSGDGLRLRLILVDNVSDDGAEQWRDYFPEMVVLRNERRLGYGANLNRVLAASDAPFSLLLNTDMYFEPADQCVAKMVDFLNRHPRCGVAGCRLLHEDGEHAPSARRFQTLSTILARRCGMGKILRGAVDDYFYRDLAIDDTWECDWLSGCFLMVRREAFREVGYFDTRFEKYFEDVDLCRRMTRAGWRVMYNGGAYCYHLEQRASISLFSADARVHVRSYLRWLRKWGFSQKAA